MKNQYFGDVGDFGKYGLLLSILDTGLKLGVNWYLTKDDDTNDGNYINYLKSNSNYRYEKCNSELFNYLNTCIENNERNVHKIEQYSGFDNVIFYSDIIDVSDIKALSPQGREKRKSVRNNWFEASLLKLNNCDIIFLDPDNGLIPESKSDVEKDSVKYVFYDEIKKLYNLGKSIIVYNHRDHSEELNYIKRFHKINDELGHDIKMIKLRSNRYSVRDYIFVLQPYHYHLVKNQIDNFLNSHWNILFTTFQ